MTTGPRTCIRPEPPDLDALADACDDDDDTDPGFELDELDELGPLSEPPREGRARNL